MWCNVGNIAGEIAGPAMRHYVGFALPMFVFFCAQVLGTMSFAAGTKFYRKVPPRSTTTFSSSSSPSSLNMITDGREPLLADMSSSSGLSMWRRFARTCYSLRHVLKVFVSLPCFFALLFQQNSVWVFQGQSMNQKLGKITIQPDSMSSFDDILCVIMIPLFERAFSAFHRRKGYDLPSLVKMSLGMGLIAIAYVICGLLQLYIDRHPAPDQQISILWQVPQYVFTAAGEVLVAIPGLEFSYSQAPPALKNVVTALWMLTNALGSAIIIAVAAVPALNNAAAAVFFGYAVAMVVFLGIFLWLTRGFVYAEAQTTAIEEVDG